MVNWTLNRALIRDGYYRAHITADIEQYFKLNEDCGVVIPVVWDAFKAVLRGSLLSMSAACKKEREKLVKELKDNIRLLEQRHLRFGGNKILRKLNIARKKLELAETAAIKKNTFS